MLMVVDDGFQVGDMIVGQTLHLGDLADGHVLFPAVDLHLLDALSRSCKVAFGLADVTHSAGIYHIIAQIQFLVFAVYIALEVFFHPAVHLGHLRRNAEVTQDLI